MGVKGVTTTDRCSPAVTIQENEKRRTVRARPAANQRLTALDKNVMCGILQVLWERSHKIRREQEG